MRRIRLYVLMALFAFPACARAGDIQVTDAWSSGGFAAGRPIAVYLTIVNLGEAGDRLTAVSTPAARRVEMHVSEMSDNVMRMRGVSSVPVAAHETVAFAPGGLHLMLIGPTRLYRPGDVLPLTLTFERAGSIQVDAAVRAASGAHSLH